MPATILAASAGTIQDNGLANGIITQMNALLATILNKTFDTFQVSVADATRILGNEINVVAGYKATGATITNPYKINVFQGASLTAVIALLQAWITANPTYWIGPIRVQYAPNESVSALSPYFAVVLYNENTSDGAANWSAMG
jgi:hypothetical protein